ncbi:MAG: hypothetical protein V4584_01690 [Verrucomicrobiota bacterium]
MKPTPSLVILPLVLGIGVGFVIGKQRGGASDEDAGSTERTPRESGAGRANVRNDPFGGPAFSLSSMEDVRGLFKKQSHSVAAARLTLGANSLSAAEIPALMEMIRQDALSNPADEDVRLALMNSLFERWAAVDPGAAVGYVRSCKETSLQLTLASRCFNALAQVDPARALVEVADLPKGDMRSFASNEILLVLAGRDPEAACDLLDRESINTFTGSFGPNEVFMKWASMDPVAAAARLATMSRDKIDSTCTNAVARVWASKDPDAALKWAKSLRNGENSGAAIQIYRVYARQDPEAAWERLKSEPGYLRGKLIGGVIQTVADEDPRKAVALLNGLESKSQKRIAANQLLEQFKMTETRLAFEIAAGLGDPAIRKEQLGDQMFYAAWNDPDLFKEQVAKLSEREKIDTGGSVVMGLISSDPAAAEKYFLGLPETQRNGATLERMMRHYYYHDAGKALAFAVSLANPQEQTTALTGLFNTWSQNDPEAAAVGWKRLPEGQGRLETLDGIANSWAEADPISAKAWADGLSGIERTRALAAVLPTLARDNPAAAGRQLSGLIASPPDGMEKNLAASAGRLAGQWADDNPTAASNWAAALPDGQSRDEGLKAVSQSWSQYDAVATAQWLGTLEAGNSRDAAIQPLVNQVRNTDPDTAFSWAASISDDNQRLNELRQTLKSWRGSDLHAARAAFDAAELSAKERESLAKELE